MNRLTSRLQTCSSSVFSSPFLKMSTNTVRSTAASGSQVYESQRAVDEYLLFHYGQNQDFLPFPDVTGMEFALDFTKRIVQIANRVLLPYPSQTNKRVLDLGCAVGGLSFELSRENSISEVVGLDFSHHFIDTAKELQKEGKKNYQILHQGEIFQTREVSLLDKTDIRRDKVHFVQGDACNLDPNLGKFDIIFGSNLLCRLPNPSKFLAEIPSFLTPQGVLILVSPYSWLEEYTPKEEWIGARRDNKDGQPKESFEILSEKLNQHHLELIHRENIPFLIREHQRKFQLGISDYTVWKRSV